MVLLVTFCLLLALGVGASYASTRLNRQRIELQAQARALIRSHLKAQMKPIEIVLRECRVCDGDWIKAKYLLECLSRSLGIGPGTLPGDTSFRSILRIKVSELGRASSSYALAEYIEPFGYDVVEDLLFILDKKAFKRRWQGDVGLPQDDDALIDFILNMTICEYVGFFSPLVRGDKN